MTDSLWKAYLRWTLTDYLLIPQTILWSICTKPGNEFILWVFEDGFWICFNDFFHQIWGTVPTACMVFVCLSFNPRNILFEVHAPKQENELICVFVCLLGRRGGGGVDNNFVSTIFRSDFGNLSNSVVFVCFPFYLIFWLTNGYQIVTSSLQITFYLSSKRSMTYYIPSCNVKENIKYT